MGTILKYLKQPSTWQGIVSLFTALGVALNPEQVAAIVSAGVGVVGVILVFWNTDEVAAAKTLVIEDNN